MKSRMLLVFFTLALHPVYAQTSCGTAFDLNAYFEEVTGIERDAINSLIEWREALNGYDISQKGKTWNEFQKKIYNYRYRLADLEEPEGDPGFLDAARSLVKFIYYECDNRLRTIQYFAEHGSREESAVQKHQSMYIDVLNEVERLHSATLFYQAWLVARATVKSPQAFCSSVTPMPEIILAGFPGYKGELIRQVNENTAEYNTLKMFPGAKRGTLTERRGIPVVSYVMYEGGDSAVVRSQFQSLVFQTLACELPGTKGKFYDSPKPDGQNINIQSCYLHFPGTDYFIELRYMKTPARKYEATLVFGKRG